MGGSYVSLDTHTKRDPEAVAWTAIMAILRFRSAGDMVSLPT